MMKLRHALGAAVFLLVAPNSATAQDQFPRELETDAKVIIRDGVARSLRDPASARFRWNPMSDATIYCGFVNARNAYGGYGGFQLFMVMLEADGSFFKVDISSPSDGLMAPVIERMCQDRGYNTNPLDAVDD